ncbi:MAG TPA: 50S ribosomal protein L11 methyltransferase [Acetobacteraceae bacterium]|nr:50S ribosomal protein L11 methyltransferase [Acetobacteraceae bacterium]
MSPVDPRRFILEQTAPALPPLLPEISLHLASEITPIWQATEAYLDEQGIAPPYWAFAWPGSIALARHMLDAPALVAGRRVLDFAAGSGLAAIAAMRAGAASATAVEIDPLAGAAIALNAEANRVAVQVLIGDITGTEPQAELIICGDICYEAPMTRQLWPWLRRCARRAEIWLADPGRAYLPAEGLQDFAEYMVPTTHELESRTSRKVTLYRLTSQA